MIQKNSIYEVVANIKGTYFYTPAAKGTLLVCTRTNKEYKKWADTANKKGDMLRKKIAQGVTGHGYSGHIGYVPFLADGFHEFKDIINNQIYIIHEDDVKLVQKP